LGCAVTGGRPPLRRRRKARPPGPCPVNFTGSTVGQPPVVHFRGRGVHADFARVEVDLIPAQAREFTEAQVGEKSPGAEAPSRCTACWSTCPSGAAAGPAQSASRRSAALNPRACHIRATCRSAQGSATVTHGQLGSGDQDRCSRRSAARPGDRTSKLVMRVRFPSSDTVIRSQKFQVCAVFRRLLYRDHDVRRCPLRARWLPAPPAYRYRFARPRRSAGRLIRRQDPTVAAGPRASFLRAAAIAGDPAVSPSFLIQAQLPIRRDLWPSWLRGWRDADYRFWSSAL